MPPHKARGTSQAPEPRIRHLKCGAAPVRAGVAESPTELSPPKRTESARDITPLALSALVIRPYETSGRLVRRIQRWNRDCDLGRRYHASANLPTALTAGSHFGSPTNSPRLTS
jgi:hypothetical protein